MVKDLRVFGKMKQERSGGRQLDGLSGDGLTRDREIVEWHRHSKKPRTTGLFKPLATDYTLLLFSLGGGRPP